MSLDILSGKYFSNEWDLDETNVKVSPGSRPSNLKNISFSTRGAYSCKYYVTFSESAELLSQEHLLVAVDDLGTAAGIGQIPSMKKIKSGLEKAGYKMSRCHMPEAMFATDADWETVLSVARLAE